MKESFQKKVNPYFKQRLKVTWSGDGRQHTEIMHPAEFSTWWVIDGKRSDWARVERAPDAEE